MQSKSNIPFRIATGVTLGLMAMTGIFVILVGKNESFLWVNGWHTPFFDFFFTYFTYLGDGIMWVPLGLYCLFFNRRYLLVVILGILLSTAFTHIFKQWLMAGAPRPISLQTLGYHLHLIEGVKVNGIKSFPSGHTGQAFTMALLIAFLAKKNYWGILLPLLAFGVAWSRVYLAQHFVVDVLGGMAVGVLAARIALFLGIRNKE